jgi:hypothetical protein
LPVIPAPARVPEVRGVAAGAELPVLPHRGEGAVDPGVAHRVRIAEEAEADPVGDRPAKLALALTPEVAHLVVPAHGAILRRGKNLI